MNDNRIVVIGGSAGSIEALRTRAKQLPADFDAPLCVVIHTSPDSPGMLPEIVTNAGRLPAQHAESGVRMQPGRFYIAPPDYHLIVEDGLLRLTKGPRENRFRPAVDPLFRSAAHCYGPAAIGLVLSGGLDDGTAGLLAIKQPWSRIPRTRSCPRCPLRRRGTCRSITACRSPRSGRS